jgi:hypothetical protein
MTIDQKVVVCVATQVKRLGSVAREKLHGLDHTKPFSESLVMVSKIIPRLTSIIDIGLGALNPNLNLISLAGVTDTHRRAIFEKGYVFSQQATARDLAAHVKVFAGPQQEEKSQT